MTWYYADGSRQVGPIDDTALDELVRAGVVRDDTLVWHDGMPNWQAHGTVRGVRPPPPPPMTPMPPAADTGYCSECGRPFPMGQLVGIGNASVCAQCKPIYLQRFREGGQGIGARRYGGFWIRFVARLIDGVILAIIVTVVNIPVEMMLGFSGRMANPATMMGMVGILSLINIAIQCIYETYFLSTRGATPGKMALGLRVVRTDGSMLTAGRAAGRYFAQILSAIPLAIGYIMAGIDDQKRALHDRLCDTRVIYAK